MMTPEQLDELKRGGIAKIIKEEIRACFYRIEKRLEQAQKEDFKYFDSNIDYAKKDFELAIQLYTELAKYV